MLRLAKKAKWSQSERLIPSVRGMSVINVSIIELIRSRGEQMIKRVVQANSWRGLLLAGLLLLVIACTQQQTIERPDLLPKMTAPQFCSLDTTGGIKRLVVTITNQGAHIPRGRPPIRTRVVFPARQAFQGASVTLVIPPGFSWSRDLDYRHIIDIPRDAFEPDLISITADYGDVIDESNEDNNTTTGVCVG